MRVRTSLRHLFGTSVTSRYGQHAVDADGVISALSPEAASLLVSCGWVIVPDEPAAAVAPEALTAPSTMAPEAPPAAPSPAKPLPDDIHQATREQLVAAARALGLKVGRHSDDAIRALILSAHNGEAAAAAEGGT